MSAFIPDQLDQMSKGELLEFAKTAHEYNVKLKAEKKKDLLTTVADYVLEVLRSENIENFSTNALSTNEGRRVELTIRYVDGDTPADKLEQQQSEIDQLRKQLANAKKRVKELEAKEQQLLTYLEDAHSHIGHLAAHLAGRIADGARFEMAKRADEWREYCEQLRKEKG